MRQRAALAPKSQRWCRSALPWVMDLAADFQAYIEHAIDEEPGRIEEYCFRRHDQAFWVADASDAAPSHKSAGAGLTRFHYEKMLA